MIEHPASALEDPSEEIAALVRALHETQQRLQALAGGEVDAVIHPGGHSYMLHEAQENLRRSEAVQREFAATQSSILNALPAHIALLDQDGVILSVNEGWRQFSGNNSLVESSTGVGRNYLEVCERAVGACAEEAHEAAVGIRAVLSGAAGEFSLDYLCHSPTEQLWFRLKVNPILQEGRPGAVVMHLNITEGRLAEEAMRASEFGLAAAQRIAHLGSWELDLTETSDIDANALRWSDEMFRLAGYEPGAVEVSNELFFRLIPGDEHQAIREAAAKAIRERGPYSIVHRLLRPDGEERIIHETAQIFLDEKTGQPLKMIGTAQDITERQRAEEHLNATEAVLRQFIEHAPAAIAMFDTKLRYLQTSARWIQDYQLAGREIIGKSHYEIFPDLPQRWKDIHQRVLAGAVDRCEEAAFPRADGTIEWLQWEVRPWRTAGGEIGGLLMATQIVTARRRAADALRESEERLALATQSAHLGIWEWNVVTNELVWDATMYALYGIREQDFSGAYDAWQSGVHPEDRQRAEAELLASVDGVNGFHTEFRIVWPGGEVREIEAHAVVRRADDGSAPRMIGINRDITERKRMEEVSHQRARLTALETEVRLALLRRESLAETLRWCCEAIVQSLDGAFARIWMLNEREQMLELQASAGLYTHLDGPHSRVPVGKFKIGLIAEERQPHLTNQVVGDPRVGDQEWARREGMVAFAGYPLLVQDRLIGVVAMFARHPLNEMSLTALATIASHIAVGIERKQSEEAIQRQQTELREGEERLRAALSASGTGTFRWDLRTNEVDWDESLDALYGLPPGQTVRSFEIFLGMVHADDRPGLIAHCEYCVREGADFDLEFRVVWPDGSVHWLDTKGRTFPDDAGQPLYMTGACVDITNRKQAEREVRLNEQRYRSLVEATTAIVWDTPASGEFEVPQPSWSAFTGQSLEELLGWGWLNAIHPDDQPETARVWSAAVANRSTYEVEHRLHAHDGTYRDMMVRAVPILAEDGTIVQWIGIHTDITERKKLEQQILRSQRMESIGTLAGGIAHDLNNVLGPIIMALDLLNSRFSDPQSQELISIISSSAQRGADMVRQVLSFGRGVEGRRMDLQIKHLVREIEKIANDTFLKHIRIRTALPQDLWTVSGDPTQLHQVLLNLCVNARDAMPDGGTLTISAENVTFDAHYAGLNLDAHAGPYVALHVEDTGTGIPPAVMEKIFDPFFTTKELGKGTGLGLSTTLGIIKSHGGFIRAYSELRKGTKFRIYLPALTETSPEEIAALQAEMPRGHGELILVVDDESSVREITRQTLEAFGYRVVLASDGAEAVAIYASRQGEIAVLLTDMMMPGIDGPATIQVLRKMNPTLPIIAASGLSNDGQLARITSLGVKHFLPKPYTAETLLKTLRAVLPTKA